MSRITVKDLRAKIERLNGMLKREPGTIGSLELDQAYGGYAIHIKITKSGGVSRVLPLGHIPAREMYAGLCGIEAGIRLIRERQ